MCGSRTWDALQAIKFYKSASIYKSYCSISFNLAPSVTHHQLAEILVFAGPRFECYIQIYLAGRVNFVLEAHKLSILNWIISITYILHVNTIGEPPESFLYFWSTFSNFQMVSALYQNSHYLHYILVILSPASHVTARLNEILQY